MSWRTDLDRAPKGVWHQVTVILAGGDRYVVLGRRTTTRWVCAGCCPDLVPIAWSPLLPAYTGAVR